MALSHAMLAALKAISYSNIFDVKKTFKAYRALDNLLSRTYKASEDYEIFNDFVDSKDGYKVPVRMFLPKDKDFTYTFLFFHGGGWVTGNIDSYDRVCVDMVKNTGQRVISVDYRLAPEHPFPTGLYDCYAVIKEVYKSEKIDSNFHKVVLIGDSAGGNLAAAVSMMLRDNDECIPYNQILIYPAVYNNHTESSPFLSIRENGSDYLLTSKRICEYTELYIQDEKHWQSPYFAPLLADNFENQPRTLIITAEFCPLRDEGEYYGEKLKENGVDTTVVRVLDGLHGFFSLPDRFDQVKAAYKAINTFLGIDFSDDE